MSELLRLFWRFASTAGTFSASSEATGFDVENLQRSTVASKWKSLVAGGGLLHTVTVDLGSAQGTEAFSLLGHDILETDTIILRHADDAGFSVNVGTVPVTWRVDNLLEYFSTVTAQYWRLEITVSNATDVREAGVLYLGPFYQATVNAGSGFISGPGRTTSKVAISKGGQGYGDLGASLDEMSFTLRGLTDADYDEIVALVRTYQTAMAFIVSIDFTDQPVRESIYGRLTRTPRMANFGIDKWTTDFVMVEQK